MSLKKAVEVAEENVLRRAAEKYTTTYELQKLSTQASQPLLGNCKSII